MKLRAVSFTEFVSVCFWVSDCPKARLVINVVTANSKYFIVARLDFIVPIHKFYPVRHGHQVHQVQATGIFACF